MLILSSKDELLFSIHLIFILLGSIHSHRDVVLANTEVGKLTCLVLSLSFALAKKKKINVGISSLVARLGEQVSHTIRDFPSIKVFCRDKTIRKLPKLM